MTDTKRRSAASFTPLIFVTLTNYAAQVPYFIHNDYSAAHSLPGLRAVLLLGATLVWFAVGLAGISGNRGWGFGVFISFLITEAFFYAVSIISGAFIFQLENPSNLLKEIYVIGYVSGAVAAYYAYRLIRERRRAAIGAGPAGGQARRGKRHVSNTI